VNSPRRLNVEFANRTPEVAVGGQGLLQHVTPTDRYLLPLAGDHHVARHGARQIAEHHLPVVGLEDVVLVYAPDELPRIFSLHDRDLITDATAEHLHRYVEVVVFIESRRASAHQIFRDDQRLKNLLLDEHPGQLSQIDHPDHFVPIVDDEELGAVPYENAIDHRLQICGCGKRIGLGVDDVVDEEVLQDVVSFLFMEVDAPTRQFLCID